MVLQKEHSLWSYKTMCPWPSRTTLVPLALHIIATHHRALCPWSSKILVLQREACQGGRHARSRVLSLGHSTFSLTLVLQSTRSPERSLSRVLSPGHSTFSLTLVLQSTCSPERSLSRALSDWALYLLSDWALCAHGPPPVENPRGGGTRGRPLVRTKTWIEG